MFIRVASKTDAQRIYEIHTSAIREICAKHYSDKTTQAWITRQYVERYFKSIEKEEIFVVVDGGDEDGGQQVTGFGHLSPQPDDVCETSATSEQDNWDEAYIKALYIHPGHVGRGQGRYLLEYMENKAQEKKAKKITILSAINAVTFYQKHGFEFIESVTKCVNNADLDCTKMEKQL